MPIIPITKEFVGVTDIMKIFRCSYFKAKIMLKDAKKYDTEGARCIGETFALPWYPKY